SCSLLLCSVACSISSIICTCPVPALFPYTSLFRSLCCPSYCSLLFFSCFYFCPLLVVANFPDFHFPGIGNSRNFQLRDPGKSREDRKSTRLNSSHVSISYYIYCL